MYLGIDVSVFTDTFIWEMRDISGDSSPKNKNVVINYSPSCLSKPVRTLFIIETHIKFFFYEFWELSDPPIDRKDTIHGQGPET